MQMMVNNFVTPTREKEKMMMMIDDKVPQSL